MSFALKRRMLLKACEVQDQSPHGDFQHFALYKEFPEDLQALSEMFGEILRAGFVVPSVRPPPLWKGVQRSDLYTVTTRGRTFLDHAAKVGAPEDVEGFLALVRRDPKLDPFVEAAAAEALWAYQSDHPIASIMCLFAAMERVLKAVASVHDVDVERKNTNGVYVALGNRLAKQAKTAPSVQAFLSSTFPAVRKARNDAAHKADAPDLDKVRVLLCQFVTWYDAAVMLRNNPVA